MEFESSVITEDWMSAVIVPMCKGKGEGIVCKNYICHSLLFKKNVQGY